jgi:hypothetical protein
VALAEAGRELVALGFGVAEGAGERGFAPAGFGELLLELVGVALGGALDAFAGGELALEACPVELEGAHALALLDQPGGRARVEVRARRTGGLGVHRGPV